ncbi:DAK2 domain-containing protein [Salininema proteolyticum]|uniref:DAK2 domain-containing protein n=1 Tax=Salininema proteolyticum TaxID=1607685 RepID=A0ABV8TYP9_9ACTN
MADKPELPDADRNAAAIDADVLRRWADRASTALAARRGEIDELNVFPVADSDTATNMHATLVEATSDCDPGLGVPGLLDHAAGRALVAARGNSGVILAQMIAGLADAWTTDTVGPQQFATGLRRAADSAMAAVAQPTAGTILTVAETAATAAANASSLGLMSTVRAAAESAADAVAATPQQLPALARAGVVDSGALAFTLILEALVEALGGSSPGGASALLQDRQEARPTPVEPVVRESGSETFEYEIQYLLETPDEAIEGLRTRLSDLGDSVVIVGSRAPHDDSGRKTFNVHVHANDVGAAIEEGIDRGRVRRIAVTRFDDALAPAVRRDRSTITVTRDSALFSFLGEQGSLVSDGSSAEEVLSVIHHSGGAEIIVLVDDPSRHDALRVAVRIARSEGYRIAVIPTLSVMQSIASLAVADPEASFDDDVIARAETASACTGVTVAADADGYTAESGGEIVAQGPDPLAVAREAVDRYAGDGAELLTFLTPARGGADDIVGALSDHLAETWPETETQWLGVHGLTAILYMGAE